MDSPSQAEVLPGENPVGGMTHWRKGGRGGVCCIIPSGVQGLYPGVIRASLWYTDRVTSRRSKQERSMHMRTALWSIVVGGIIGALPWTGPAGAQGLPGCLRQLGECTASLGTCKAAPR